MKFIKIINWSDMVSQFGLDKAKDLSKKLRDAVVPDKLENMAINFDSDKTEAVVLFEYLKTEKNEFVFEYTGTAN